MLRNGKRAVVCGMALAGLVVIAPAVLAAQQVQPKSPANRIDLCLDGFCIGQSINDTRFNSVGWIIPHDLTREPCNGVGCMPQIAFRGYEAEYQKPLAEAVSWIYGFREYNIIRNDTLEVLRHYKYECNLSARGLLGERRFFGAYRSIPSRYLTVIGLRLIDGELKVYRIARQYPYHTQAELISLAKTLHDQYGETLLLYGYLSSNAYSDVIDQNKNGWFGRSSMFNPNDLSDNTAELVLVDPRTRSLLEPSSLPESGEIKPLAVKPPAQCSQSLSIQ
jgi:hypothetical protein